MGDRLLCAHDAHDVHADGCETCEGITLPAVVGPPLQFRADGAFTGLEVETCVIDGCTGSANICLTHHEALEDAVQRLHAELSAAEEQSSLQRDRAKRAELEAERLRSISDEKSLRLIGAVSRIDLDKGQVSVTFDASEAVLRRLAPLMLQGSVVEASFPIEEER